MYLLNHCFCLIPDTTGEWNEDGAHGEYLGIWSRGFFAAYMFPESRIRPLLSIWSVPSIDMNHPNPSPVASQKPYRHVLTPDRTLDTQHVILHITSLFKLSRVITSTHSYETLASFDTRKPCFLSDTVLEMLSTILFIDQI